MWSVLWLAVELLRWFQTYFVFVNCLLHYGSYVPVIYYVDACTTVVGGATLSSHNFTIIEYCVYIYTVSLKNRTYMASVTTLLYLLAVHRVPTKDAGGCPTTCRYVLYTFHQLSYKHTPHTSACVWSTHASTRRRALTPCNGIYPRSAVKPCKCT